MSFPFPLSFFGPEFFWPDLPGFLEPLADDAFLPPFCGAEAFFAADGAARFYETKH